ncbi:unnamed protein product [Brachionus calyciflorus]|uniref:MULE transposase domain-containing protein n=1 Tax=Brachionus calyciflorus TaxID=104777 RepID=A0A814QMP6_9BILA|nr:unnamed protein product [Brachionus calyciflorus]
MDKNLKKLNLNTNYQSPMRLRSRAIPKSQPVYKSTVSEDVSPETDISQSIHSMIDTFNDFTISNEFSSCVMSSTQISVSSSIGKIVDYDSSDSEIYDSSESNKKTQVEYYNENDLNDSSNSLQEENSDEAGLLVTKTTKNMPRLIFQDYEFVIDKSHKQKIYWKCVHIKPLCKARIHTNLSYEIVKIVNNEHIHEPPIDDIAAKNVRVDIKKRASETSENPRKLITDCLTKLPLSSAPLISSTRGLTQMVQRERQKVNNFGREAKSREEVNLNIEYTVTHTGENFVLFDSGSVDRERIIIFGTTKNLELLNSESTWFVDGTFDISPDVFIQLFTVNIIKGGKNLPLLYALLPNKEKSSYERVFKFISKNVSNKPEFIVSDFEQAILNCVTKYYSKSKVSGCYFHLASNLWKKVSKKGLVKTYRLNENFRKFFKYLKVLPFVPLKDTIYAFEFIKSQSPAELAPVIHYFEKNYIGFVDPEDENCSRVVPKYPPSYWNLRKRIQKGLPRSNNSLEAWHKSLSQDIGSHPNVNKLAKHLKNEQHLTDVLIEQINSGIVYPREKSEIKKDNEIMSLFSAYNKDKLANFFDRLILVFK